MTLSNTGPFGPFRYTVPSDSWWWSEEVYAIHGFQPGAVVPSTELMLAHAHPSDSEALSRAHVLPYADAVVRRPAPAVRRRREPESRPTLAGQPRASSLQSVRELASFLRGES